MKLVVETLIRAPIERCFDLARSVDAHVATQEERAETAVAGRLTGLMELGETVTWRARHLGVTQHLTSTIVSLDRPRAFRDSMVTGAFARFDHDHFFEAREGGTLMRDVFDFASPFGPIGWIVDRLFLGRYMRRFLVARAEVLRALAESEAWRKFVPG